MKLNYVNILTSLALSWIVIDDVIENNTVKFPYNHIIMVRDLYSYKEVIIQ